jgi:hypothetical protein
MDITPGPSRLAIDTDIYKVNFLPEVVAPQGLRRFSGVRIVQEIHETADAGKSAAQIAVHEHGSRIQGLYRLISPADLCKLVGSG